MLIEFLLGNVSRATWISNTPCHNPEIAPCVSQIYGFLFVSFFFFFLLFSDQSQALSYTTASTVLLAKSTLALEQLHLLFSPTLPL